MKRRQWDSKTKAVLEGLSGKPVGELCTQYQISQNFVRGGRSRPLHPREKSAHEDVRRPQNIL